MMRRIITLILSGLIFGFLPLFSQTYEWDVSDNASTLNYPSGNWNDASNGGSGFGEWSFSQNGTAGRYIGTTGLSSSSFGIFSSGVGAFYTATRPFEKPLKSGDTFTVEIGHTTTIDGEIGLLLLDGTTVVFTLKFPGGSSDWKLNDGGSDFGSGQNYAANTALTFTFSYNGSNNYSYTFGSGSGDNFSATSTLTNINGVRFYNNNQGSGQNFGFNNLSISGSASSASDVPTNADVEISGNVNLLSTETLTVNDLTIPSSKVGTLTVKSDASGTASLITNGSVLGDVNVERYLSQDIYHYIASPINYTSGTFDDLSLGLAAGDDFRRYETSSNLWIDILNGPDGIFGNTDDLMDNETFVRGSGYAIAYAGENKTLSLSGTLNNGDIDVNVVSGGVGNNAGFNLVGNPYPSTLQASAFLAANNSTDGTINQRIGGTLYFWDEPGSGDFGKSDYATRTASAGNPGGGNKTPTDYIDPGQGFFVSAVSTGNIAFRNNQRVHGTSEFFKNESDKKDFKLSVQNLETLDQNTITVVFDKNSTEGFDDLYDAVKLQGNPDLALYSFAENRELAINALPEMKEGLKVPIGLKALLTGTYKFSVHTMQNYEPGTPIVLEDKVTGIQTDLSVNPEYTFTIDAPGTYDDRFVLYFKSAVGIQENVSIPQPIIYIQNQQLSISNIEEGKVNLRIIDIMGRVVAAESLVNVDGRINLPINLNSGVYILEITTNNHIFACKISVN